MFIIENYSLAVIFCVITMLCWGSWANTQKLAAKSWRFELFYWDYVIGVVALALIFAFTLGSFGEGGRGFLTDIRQAAPANIGSALLGGVVFNAANILLVAAIAIAGMSFSIIAAGKAGYAISYGLGQGATLVAALWGVFIWKEFKGASKHVNLLLGLMFVCFVAGIALIILAGK